jgi:sec-independent protein translocase protein TatB
MTATVGLFIFDIGWPELVVIGVVALIAIGPKELPTVLRTLGQYMGKLKRMSSEFQSQFQEALREAELSDLKKHAQDIQSTVTDFTTYDPLADGHGRGRACRVGARDRRTAA